LTEIEHRPWKKIVVHEVKELTPKDFFEGMAAAAESQGQGASPTVTWADGVAFVWQFFPETDRVLSEKLDGVLHMNLVQFTRTSFEPEKSATVGGKDHTINMMKSEDNPEFVALAKFLNSLKPLDTKS